MKVTNVNDYVDAVHEKFPELTREEVKRILVYGWKQIIQYVSAGNDIQIITPKNFFFIGRIPVSGLATFKNYIYKLQLRIAYMFRRTKSKWDGHYYFALNEAQYKDYLSQNRKKYKVFKNIMIYKLLEQLRIKENNKRYIFRLNEDRTAWMHKFYPEIKTKDAELIEIRDALTMNDILTSVNKFKYLQ